MRKLHNLIGRAAQLVFVIAAVLAANTAVAQLEEVVVTATKRSESLQDAAISITALSGDDLESMGAENLLDFTVRVPNLAAAYEADGRFDSSSPAIRGVFGVNTVGFYIDDTQVTASLLPRVVDLERIEVLRGPQGSLYGARSMGGTIRLITKQPSLTETEGSLKLGLASVADGDLNNNIDAAWSFPVIDDRFGLRISAYYGSNSGVQDRVYQSTWRDDTNSVDRQNSAPEFQTNEDVDEETYWGAQIVGAIQFGDNFTFVPRFITQRVDSDGLPFADVEPDSTEQPRFFDTEEPGTDEWSIWSATFNWELGGGAITSVTSRYERETDEDEEEHHFLNWLYDEPAIGIGQPIDPLESSITTIEDYESVTHETRFTSSFDGAFQFTAGIYYQDLRHVHRYPPALQAGVNDALNASFGVAADLAPGDLIFVNDETTDTEELALFGEVTVEFSDRFSVTAGGRYYDTEVAEVGAANGFANSGPSSHDNKQSESGFNPRVLAEFAPGDAVNLFASASKGFRTGGVNGNVSEALCGTELAGFDITVSDVPLLYDSDELWSYELGAKFSLANNRFSLNTSVFYIDWTDIQQLNRLSCGFQYSYNAGEAESRGFELELNAAPTDNLVLALGIGYTDAEITDTGDAFGVAKGDDIQGVPDWTVTGSVAYNFRFSSEWEGVWRVDANHYGDSYSANNESSGATQRLREAWSAVNMRLSAISERYEITLFADNLTDERANLADSRSIAAETPGRQRLVTNRPRTVGLEGRVRF